MSQTEGPQTQVRGSVGDAAQTVLYGVDGLMHESVGSIKLLFNTSKNMTHMIPSINSATHRRLTVKQSYKLFIISMQSNHINAYNR